MKWPCWALQGTFAVDGGWHGWSVFCCDLMSALVAADVWLSKLRPWEQNPMQNQHYLAFRISAVPTFVFLLFSPSIVRLLHNLLIPKPFNSCRVLWLVWRLAEIIKQALTKLPWTSLNSSFSIQPSVKMMSRTLLRTATTFARPRRIPIQLATTLLNSRCHLRYATTVVKVPQMAESISEGTLKQFSKKVGDYVEVDEEIATIETDKVRNMVFGCAIKIALSQF